MGSPSVDLPSNLVWFDEAGRHQESLQADRPVGEQLLSQFHRAVTSLAVRKNMTILEDAIERCRLCWRLGRAPSRASGWNCGLTSTYSDSV